MTCPAPNASSSSPSRFRSSVVPILATAAALLILAAGCRPEVVVRLSTRIFVDGSVERQIVIDGRSSEGELPTEPSWFRKTAGVDLAAEERWPRVERRPDRIEASGFFPGVEGLPPVLTFHNELGVRDDPSKVSLEIERRGVLRRWSYLETHGDPFGSADRTAALQALTEMAVELLGKELEGDVWPAEKFLREDGVGLVQALLQWRRGHSGFTRREERIEGYEQILRQAGVPGIQFGESDDFWESAIPELLGWARAEVRQRLNDAGNELPDNALDFWPAGEDWEDMAEALVRRHWGEDDLLWQEIAPHLDALGGRYGGDGGTRFRFEVETVLPGQLLRTNGTPNRDSVLWIFRDADLADGEVRLRAVSAEPVTEMLVSLGARRDLDTRDLLQLEDLLWRRDTEGILLQRLEAAIEAGSLDGLREEQVEEDLWVDLARELADLLEPNSIR